MAPDRRGLFRAGAGLAAAGISGANVQALAAGGKPLSEAAIALRTGRSPWGYQTDKEPTPRPHAFRPGEETGLPERPRAYTDIESYPAHIYFDEDSYEKAALIRKWAAERFLIELGN